MEARLDYLANKVPLAMVSQLRSLQIALALTTAIKTIRLATTIALNDIK